jgi:hypothetical protein
MSAIPGFPEHGGIGDRLSRIESQISKLNRMRRLESASVGAGGITFKDGGAVTFLDTSGNTLFTIDENGLVTFEADGSQLSVLDGSKLRFNRADGSRILEVTPGGGFKVYATNGTTERVVVDGDGVDIASGKVVLDSTGLEVDGGNVQAVWPATGDDTAQNVTVTVTQTEFLSVTIDPPAWVQSLFVFATATGQFSNTTGSAFRGEVRLILDKSGASQEAASGTQNVLNNVTQHLAVSEVLTVPLSPAGRAVDVTMDAFVTSGTSTNNLFGLKVLAVGVRDAFV